MGARADKFIDWLRRYERHVSSGALVSGFIIDALTLKRIDLLFENAVLISYFILVATGILALNVIEVRQYSGPFVRKILRILPIMIQFAFGGLFSGFTIFYFRSGSLAASWPFIIILVSLLLGNELLKRQYERLVFQITVFFISLFFFTIFFVPVVVDQMGPWIFMLSGVTALILITIFIFILFHFIPGRISQSKKYLKYSIVSTFAIINVLYFTNLIPPIPLSLKSVGVYHDLSQTPVGYVALEEKRTYLQSLQFFDNVHLVSGRPLYVYSAIFAPTNIKTEVVHHWKYFDESLNRWVTANRIPYTIVGGNDRGHRGYSVKTNLAQGEWSVDVETPRGQVIGRITFEIIYVKEVPVLVEKLL